MFKFKKEELEGIQRIKPHFVEDTRGHFLKMYEKEIYKKNGIDFKTWEAMESYSKRGVLRGLHFQKEDAQAKLVRVVLGRVYDVVVDLRPTSKTFGKWQGFYLDDVNKEMLYIPRGFAHGFLVLSEQAIFSYIADNRYNSVSDSGIKWNDEKLGIKWPIDEIDKIIVSEKDANLQSFISFCNEVNDVK